MHDLSSRLARCFATVFPELPPEEISTSTVDTVARWDSVTSVTLLSLVEEEFQIDVDFDRFEEMTSFEGLLRYLQDTAH